MIKEEMEYMGPVRLRTVEEAQQKIVSVIEQINEAGNFIYSSRLISVSWHHTVL